MKILSPDDAAKIKRGECPCGGRVFRVSHADSDKFFCCRSCCELFENADAGRIKELEGRLKA